MCLSVSPSVLNFLDLSCFMFYWLSCSKSFPWYHMGLCTEGLVNSRYESMKSSNLLPQYLDISMAKYKNSSILWLLQYYSMGLYFKIRYFFNFFYMHFVELRHLSVFLQILSHILSRNLSEILGALVSVMGACRTASMVESLKYLNSHNLRVIMGLSPTNRPWLFM